MGGVLEGSHNGFCGTVNSGLFAASFLSSWYKASLENLRWVKCGIDAIIHIMPFHLHYKQIFIILCFIVYMVWGFCRDCCIWDGVRTLGGCTTQTNMWTEDCFECPYKWYRASHTCGKWYGPLFWTFSHEINSCKVWCFLCDIWCVENISRAIFLVDWRVSPFRTS